MGLSFFPAAVRLAVLHGADPHLLVKDPAEMGRGGKARLFGHVVDAEVGGLEQAAGRFDPPHIDKVDDGLPRHPPEQPAEIVGRQVELRRHAAEVELLVVVGHQIGADLLDGLVAGRGCAAALGGGLLARIVHQQGEIEPAGTVRLLPGAGRQFQQGVHPV